MVSGIKKNPHANAEHHTRPDDSCEVRSKGEMCHEPCGIRIDDHAERKQGLGIHLGNQPPGKRKRNQVASPPGPSTNAGKIRGIPHKRLQINRQQDDARKEIEETEKHDGIADTEGTIPECTKINIDARHNTAPR